MTARGENSIVRADLFQDQEYLSLVDPDDGGYADSGYGLGPEPTGRQRLSAIFAVLRKHLFLILGITIIGTIAALIYEGQKLDYYTAEARIQVNNETNPATGGGEGADPVIFNPASDPAYFTTQLQILEGPGLIRRVVKTVDLEHNPAFFRPGKEHRASVWQNMLKMLGIHNTVTATETTKAASEIENKLVFKGDAETDLDEQAEKLAPYVSFIKRGLDVSPIKDTRTAHKETRLITVEYTHFDPKMAAKVVNAVADAYVLQNLEQKVQSNTSASDFLQKKVAELQSQIRSGEESLINYARTNQILSLDEKQNTVVQRLSDLNGKLSQAENDRITAEAMYRAAMQNPMSNASAESKDPRTTGLEQQLTTLRQQLDQLKVEYTDEWPDVKKTKRQIETIERELETNKKRSSSTQIAGLEQAFREASAREKELRNNFQLQKNTVLDQNQAAINYRIIQQEIDTNKALLNSLLQRSRETEVVLNGTPNNVRIVDRALVPGGPAGPQRTKNVMLAFIASLSLGLFVAFVLNWLDDTIRPHDNFESQLGAPLMGLIPGAPLSLARRLVPFKLGGYGKGRGEAAKYTYDRGNFDTPLMTEAFHLLRTSLLLSTAGGSPKVVLVTSGEPFEGKTVTALNLAKSLAQLGDKVLLIDGDLRCPRIHLTSDLLNRKGLSTLLTAGTVDEKLISETVQSEIERNLDILPSGPRVPNPGTLFCSVEMRRLLDRLGAAYEHIVIDSPPILYFSDSTVLSTNVDAVILVARANFSSGEVLARARKKIQDVRGNLVGIVMNDVPLNNYKYYNNIYYRRLEQDDLDAAGDSVLHLN